MPVEGRTGLLRILTYAVVLLFIIVNVLNFTYPGTERTMGEVQRLFYLHLGSFFGAFLAFVGAVVAGVQYLRTRQIKWDHLGLASVEVGLGLSLVTIFSGAIWARPIWGTFWTWDPRLTTIAIMWLTYAAYLFLRSAIEDGEQKRRFAAVYGILAFSSVILTIVIIRVRPDAIHPVVAGPTTSSTDAMGEFNVTARIGRTVAFNIVLYVLLAGLLIWHRLRLEARSEWIQARKMEILGNL